MCVEKISRVGGLSGEATRRPTRQILIVFEPRTYASRVPRLAMAGSVAPSPKGSRVNVPSAVTCQSSPPSPESFEKTILLLSCDHASPPGYPITETSDRGGPPDNGKR